MSSACDSRGWSREQRWQLFISRFCDTLTFNFREIVSEKEGEGIARSKKIVKFNEFSLNGVIWTPCRQKLDTKFIALKINEIVGK